MPTAIKYAVRTYLLAEFAWTHLAGPVFAGLFAYEAWRGLSEPPRVRLLVYASALAARVWTR